MLPRDLGKVAEVGAGPWTQTYFALRARPDARLRRAATLIYDSALITACRAGALSRLRLGGTLALTLHVTP